MSAYGGKPALRRGVIGAWVVAAMLLAACEYSGPEEQQPASPAAAATPEPRSFEENVDEVAALLGLSSTEPGMPSDDEPAGKLSLVLAPGDYMVTGACAGVYGAKLTIVGEEGVPERAEFKCDATLDRFMRHDGGPVTISAVTPTGKPSATGVKIQANPDPRLSELEDLSDWSSQQLQPRIPGELSGSHRGNSVFGSTLMAEPGTYELHIVCDGTPYARLALATAAGAEIQAPVNIICEGTVLKTPVVLPTEGLDITIDPVGSPSARFAYRLVPAGETTPAG
ncbi:hypothetical protein AB0N71_18685 [Pseudarthrobacter enclensis]|uniref:hypothetical protein n=1 Tax=Pseudarthrobacter enclensis TaxID=993070 RepID=UPI00344591CF